MRTIITMYKIPMAIHPHQGRSQLMWSHSKQLWTMPLGLQPPNPISAKVGSAKLLLTTASETN